MRSDIALRSVYHMSTFLSSCAHPLIHYTFVNWFYLLASIMHTLHVPPSHMHTHSHTCTHTLTHTHTQWPIHWPVSSLFLKLLLMATYVSLSAWISPHLGFWKYPVSTSHQSKAKWETGLFTVVTCFRDIFFKNLAYNWFPVVSIPSLKLICSSIF